MKTDVARLICLALAAIAVLLPAAKAAPTNKEEDSYFCAVYQRLYGLLTSEEQKEIDQIFKHRCTEEMDDEAMAEMIKRKPNFIRFGRTRGIQEKRKPNFIRFG